MKKFFFTTFAILSFIFTTQAQDGINIGAFIGVPISGSYASFSVGLDANYLFPITDKISVGPATGFSHSFAKTNAYFGVVYGDDFQYIPIAAAGRYAINDKMVGGFDLGYGLGINDGNDGGIYYRPSFGYNIKEKIQLNASYRGLSLGSGNGVYYRGSFAIFSVGATFNF